MFSKLSQFLSWWTSIGIFHVKKMDTLLSYPVWIEMYSQLFGGIHVLQVAYWGF